MSRYRISCDPVRMLSVFLLMFCAGGIGTGGAYATTSGPGGAPLKASAQKSSGGYEIVDTGQTGCYDTNTEIAPPEPGQAFYGQDAQFDGTQPSFTLSADGKTVFDNVTKLTWMRGPNMTLTPPVSSDKKTLSGAEAWVATVNAANYGGFSDWRLPTIKELYSLINFTGTDPSSYTGTDPSVLTPFIDTAYFNFAYGQLSAGERLIDSQYASSTLFALNPAQTGYPKLFGVNFADGRIKGYDLLAADGQSEKTFFVQLVRGPSDYGVNNFVNNGDGTVTDTATGLMWTKDDNGAALTWQSALAWTQAQNAANYLGHNDWRLPNAKELQSLVDYANAPDYNGKPAIDTTFFNCTPITNENGDADFPYYWTSTTHVGYSATEPLGGHAVYVAFGRGLGWPDGAGGWVDIHGAGCQRSDPKTGPPFPFATPHVVTRNGVSYYGYSFGPQGDAIRGLNFVRLVRDAGSTGPVNGAITVTIQPADAVSAGAQWSLDAGATWHDSGATLSDLTPGSATVSFSAIAAWVTPPSQAITILAGQTATATGAYTQIQYTLTTSVVNGHGTLFPGSGPQNANAVVSLTATPDSGYRVKAWLGTDDDAQTTNFNTVTMVGDKSVSVEFEPIPPTPGDVNGDGVANAVDVQLVINRALGLTIPDDADLNHDGRVDAVDVQMVINDALGLG